MIKRPLEEQTDDEKFSSYLPQSDLSEGEGKGEAGEASRAPTILPLSTLPEPLEQATDE